MCRFGVFYFVFFQPLSKFLEHIFCRSAVRARPVFQPPATCWTQKGLRIARGTHRHCWAFSHSCQPHPGGMGKWVPLRALPVFPTLCCPLPAGPPAHCPIAVLLLVAGWVCKTPSCVALLFSGFVCQGLMCFPQALMSLKPCCPWSHSHNTCDVHRNYLWHKNCFTLHETAVKCDTWGYCGLWKKES